MGRRFRLPILFPWEGKMDDWPLFVADLKVSLYGSPEPDTEFRAMADSKFYGDWEVWPDWSAEQWQADTWNGWKIPTRDCYTARDAYR